MVLEIVTKRKETRADNPDAEYKDLKRLEVSLNKESADLIGQNPIRFGAVPYGSLNKVKSKSTTLTFYRTRNKPIICSSKSIQNKKPSVEIENPPLKLKTLR